MLINNIIGLTDTCGTVKNVKCERINFNIPNCTIGPPNKFLFTFQGPAPPLIPCFYSGSTILIQPSFCST